jgi:hypothetical protein
MSAPTAKLNVIKEKEIEMKNELKKWQLFEYTIDGNAVVSSIYYLDIADFLKEHPEAVRTNHR